MTTHDCNTVVNKYCNIKSINIFIYFWPCHVAWGILFPQPGIEPMCPVVEARSLNHWATREVLYFLIRWKMRLCLKVPGRAKGSAKTFFGLGAGRLDGEGLMGRGVNTQLRCSHWKPRAKLPHSWAWATCVRMSWDNNSLSSQGNCVRPGEGRAPRG